MLYMEKKKHINKIKLRNYRAFNYEFKNYDEKTKQKKFVATIVAIPIGWLSVL